MPDVPMARRRHPAFPEHGPRCRHEAWILTQETSSATFHENRVYSFAHSPVDGSSFEKQNTAGQIATRQPVCVLFFVLGVDRPRWTIVLARLAALPENLQLSIYSLFTPLLLLIHRFKSTDRIGNAGLGLIGTVFFLLPSQKFLCG